MALFNSFKFGEVDSKDYGVYISGDSVYDSPARSVDMVQVPGRNGALALDNGYYENIEVTYPAGSFGTSQEEWREKMRGIRNALAAQRGYQKLIDTYHPDHYRLGMFLSGISASPVQYNRAGQFPIRFNCKPQRFLMSGDTAVEFDASTMSQTYGPSSIVSFEAVEAAPVAELTTTITPVQSGSGDPSPSNVRPITGWSEVNVNRCGKNLINFTGIVANPINSTAVYLQVGDYYCYLFIDGDIPNYNSFVRYSVDGLTFTNVETSGDIVVCDAVMGYYRKKCKLTVKQPCFLIQQIQGGAAVDKQFYVVWTTDGSRYESAPNVPTMSTLDDYYAPYVGTTTPISLGQTVYGGKLNVTTGELVVEYAIADLGAWTWSYESSIPRFYAYGIQNTVKRPATNTTPSGLVTDCFKTTTLEGSGSTIYGGQGDNLIAVSTGGVLSIRTSLYTDGAAFKSAMNGRKIVYPLATPTTYQLSPTEVSTLLGTNNIWADAGEVEVKVVSPETLTNPTNFASKPLVRIYGNGSVRVGNTVATVSNNTDYIDIDCEAMNCYDSTGNRNSDVSFSSNDFPVLEPGNNSILLNGPTKAEITPRWWEL